MTDTIPVESDLELLQRCRSLYTKSRNYRKNRYDVWYRNYRLLNNRLGANQATSWLPTPRDSQIYPTLSAIVAWMTDQRTEINFSPAADPDSLFYQFILKVCGDMTNLISTINLAQNYPKEIKLIIWDSMLYGTGIGKTTWDQTLDQGLGNVTTKRVDPWSIYIDPMASSFDDAEYITEVRKMSFDEIERRFPDSAHLLEIASSSGDDNSDDRPDIYKSSNDSFINLAGINGAQTRYGIPISSNSRFKGDPINVYEMWLKENTDDEVSSEHVVLPRWRVIVFAKEVILLDAYADELWSFDTHPYDRFVFDDIGEFYGIALVDHLAQAQIYINRLLTALQHNSELVGNPIFLESANSGLDRVGIINRPGMRLRLNGPAAMQNRPDWLQPPQMPSSVMDLVKYWNAAIERTSGLSAISKGNSPQGRSAEGVMQSVQEAAFVRIRSALSNLEEFHRATASKKADLIIDNYNDERVVAIVGPDGEQTSLTIASNHFLVPSAEGRVPLRYAVKVNAGSSAPTSRAARTSEADHLAALGAFDDVELLKRHEIPNFQSIIDRKDQRIQSGLYNPPGARQRSQRQS